VQVQIYADDQIQVFMAELCADDSYEEPRSQDDSDSGLGFGARVGYSFLEPNETIQRETQP